MSIAAHDYRPADGLRYLFIDFNAFFAAVEQHDHPELLGRPVIVAPLQSEHTGAIAVSYEARHFGIKRGTTVREARALCHGLAVMPARHDRYVRAHKQLMAEIERHLPLAKVYSIDEAAFRLNRSESTAKAALPVAHAIRRGIAENVGPALRASIGLAQTRLLAKLAAESKKPDGLSVLEPADLPGKLKDMPLTDIPGIGAGVAVRLSRAGIHDFLSLWRMQPKQARAVWGSVQGERFWYALHGYEVDEPETKKSMIGHSRVLAHDHEAPHEARIVARALLMKAASRLRHYRLYACALSLSLRLRPDGGWDSVYRFDPCQDSFFLLSTLDKLWARFMAENGGKAARLRLGGATVFLHNLCVEGDARAAQGDLFAAPADRKRMDARARLWATIDTINADVDHKYARLSGAERDKSRRYVTLARQQGLDLNYLGAKIAFSRVPEEAEFLY